MQRLIEQQSKDRVVNVRSRANLYQTIERLIRLGLVEVSETARTEATPSGSSTRSPTPDARPRARGCARCCTRAETSSPSSSPPYLCCSPSRPRTPSSSSSFGRKGWRLNSPRPRPSSLAPGWPAASLPARGGVPAGNSGGRARLGSRHRRGPACGPADLERRGAARDRGRVRPSREEGKVMTSRGGGNRRGSGALASVRAAHGHRRVRRRLSGARGALRP
jgi:hypothetical protein